MKYRFTLTRDTTESCMVVIESDSIEEAREKVLDDPRGHEGWQSDDYWGKPYLPNDDFEEVITDGVPSRACLHAVEKIGKTSWAAHDAPDVVFGPTAQLFAAAPDMLIALKDAVEQLERCLSGADLDASGDDRECGVTEYQAALAAIAKATD